MVVLMEAIHSLYDQSHGHTFSATLKLLIGSRTPTMVQLVTVCAGRIVGREFDLVVEMTDRSRCWKPQW